MTNWTTARERLERRHSELRESLAHYRRDLQTAHSGDWQERAVETEGDEVFEGQETSAPHEIEQIDAAMGRIEFATYGECGIDGDAIDRRVMEALPHGVFCIQCASTTDSG